MTDATDARALEQALIARAEHLAEERRSHARAERDRLLDEARQRIVEREAHESEVADQLAERHFRRQVQSAELAQRASLDQLRWTLLQSAFESVRERLFSLAENDDSYLPLLRSLITQAAQSIEANELVAQLNQRDLTRYGGSWDILLKEAGVTKTVRLEQHVCECRAGVLLRTPDDRIRYDNTFESRLERLREPLLREISEQLFGSSESAPGGLNG